MCSTDKTSVLLHCFILFSSRSALAAAILATTLTGRTVAIPQPRQQSLSASDSTSLEQECFEPYATIIFKYLIRGITDVSVRAAQAWENITKEKFRELERENWSLKKAYQAVVQQFEGTKQHIEEQQLKLKKLEKENKRLKEAAENSHKEVTELISLRQQAQELVDENDALKMTVHRLNVELSRYQTKFRSLSKEEVRILVIKLDVKSLSPLLLAYEDRIREKEDFILEHEEDMKNFKARVEELVKENEDLHEQLNKNNLITPTEWQQLQTQAKLVLEENGLLMEQLEIQQAKAKDSHRQHVQEASKLTQQILILEGKKQSQEEEIAEYQKQIEALCSTCEELKAKMDSRITAEEHLALVNDLKSCLQQEQEKKCCEEEEVMGKIASLQAENKKLLLEKNNFMADKKILETEMEMTQKTNRRLKKKIGLLQLQLEEAMEKEVSAHHYLTNLIALVEKIAKERDHLVFLARYLEKENHSVLKEIIEGSLHFRRLEEKVKVYTKKAAGKLGDISLKMTEQEKVFAGKTSQYEQEKKHLQRLLQDKQETLNEMLEQNRKTEGELEIMWESTAKENRRMRELLHKSLKENNMWHAVIVHEPHLDESSQKHLVYGHDFSYCDVKTSSHTKNEIQQESQ
uniref:Centrosomal protein 89 n=1 Tax=Malurus cyaneus samueli TaxID=2593467 RepID=A0A8C5UF59_9PASS